MKDPAFLMYPKDWLEGTSELSVGAKGIYVDMLCYQHQKGDLPYDFKKLSRLVRLSEAEFISLWEEIEHKFIVCEDRIINKKLNDLMSERAEKSRKNKLIGTFAHVLQTLKLNKKQAIILKGRFNVNELLNTSTVWNTESLTEWCLNGTPFIANANANKEYKEGVPESELRTLKFPFTTKEFMDIWELWKEYRKEHKKPDYKVIGEQGALAEVSNKANGNEEIAIKIIHQSINKGWTGFYELKTDNKSNESHKEKTANAVSEALSDLQSSKD